MRILVWILRLAIFIVVLLFALKNTTAVDVGLFGDHVLRGIPLIVIMLIAFALGMGFGLLLTAGALLRRRKELNRLRKELSRIQARPAPSHNDPHMADSVAPLTPL